MNTFYLVLMVVLTKIFLTLVPIAVKYTQANIWTIGVFRLTIACLFFLFITRKDFFSNWKKIWILGPLFFTHWITYWEGIKVSTPSTAVIGLSSYGVLLLLYSRIFFKTKIAPLMIFSILTALFGTFLIVENFSLENSTLQGLLWGTASAMAYAALPIVHQKFPNIPTKHKALSQFLGAFLIFLAIGLPQASWDLNTNDYYALLYLAIGGTILGHGLWVKVTETLPTTTTSGVYYLAIPLAMILEYLILDINITQRKIWGSSLILGSNFLILYLKQKKAP